VELFHLFVVPNKVKKPLQPVLVHLPEVFNCMGRISDLHNTVGKLFFGAIKLLTPKGNIFRVV
jgi:hypothetical protein